jgi:hypothetical protein
MRLACLVLLVFLIPACAARPQSHPRAEVSRPEEPEALAAGALVFDAPAGEAGRIDFPRDPRAGGAVWGIQGPTTTFLYQRTDDRYGSGWDFDSFGDRYRRRTVETRLNMSVR